ncbi:MAG: AAA family ATPase [Bacteroidia bacterium]|nr:AAA family ATPase [Bacteroidia bacterium]
MLQRLYIKNFTVFDEAEWYPESGMISITGETGAGKSVLVDALLLATGDRMTGKVIRDENFKCILEAEFYNPELTPTFPETTEDWKGIFLFRREIYPDGRSRLFLNDSPITQQEAANIARHLLEIHSQHAVLELKKKSFAYEFIDRASGCFDDYRQTYLPLYRQWQELEKAYAEVLRKTEESEKEKSYLEFQAHELKILSAAEQAYFEGLEAKVQWLEKKQNILEQLSGAFHALENSENSASAQIIKAIKHFRETEKWLSDERIAEICGQLNETLSSIRTIASTVENMIQEGENPDFHPEKILSDWDALSRLLFRHKKKSVRELFLLKEEVEEKLKLLENSDEVAEALRNKKQKIFEECRRAGMALSEKRKKSISVIQKRMEEYLKQLALPFARLEIRIEPSDTPHHWGTDHIQIYFSANAGMPPDPVEKTASGGELSRVMLAIKKCMGDHSSAPTLVLDEIDTGISGQAALQVGRFIREMAREKQVFCITHLPQVASQSHHHYKVIKETQPGKKTESRIELLNEAQRVEELATMLSHSNPGENALKAAKDLLIKNN